MYRLFFKGLVIFYRLGRGVEDFSENTRLEGERGRGGEREERISCRQKMSKGEDDENIREPYWGNEVNFI